MKLSLTTSHWAKTFLLYGFYLSVKELLRVENTRIGIVTRREQLIVEDFLYQFGFRSREIKFLESEFQGVFQVACEYSQHPSGIKYKSGLILFSLVRKNGFTKVYESGFQSGRSSQLLVAALNPTQECSVISSDIRYRDIPLPLLQTKSFKFLFINSNIHRFWQLINDSFKPELWFLDSDNRFNFQLAELRAAAVNSRMIIVNNSHVSEACDQFESEMPYNRFDFVENNRVLTVFTRKTD
jgi:hypothetical protein